MKINTMKWFLCLTVIVSPAAFAACPADYREDLQLENVGATLAPPTGFAAGKAQFSQGSEHLDSEMNANSVQPGTKAAEKLKGGETIDLTWTAAGNSCAVKVTLEGAARNGNSVGAAGTATDELSDCSKAALEYAGRIRKKQDAEGRGEFALVVFCDSGTTLQISSRRNDAIAVGDSLYAAVYASPDQHTLIKFEWPSCAPRDAAPKRFGTDEFSVIPKGGQETGVAPPHMIPEDPVVRRRCYNTDPQVKATSQLPDKQTTGIDRTETITQYERYNYSFQLGAVFTEDVDHDYTVIADSGGSSTIHDGGPEGKGPAYFAALTMYGLPYQLCTAFGGCEDHNPYIGRDLVNDMGPLDRVSGILGVGLENPGDEFLAGLGFEVMKGFNIIVVWRTAKIDALDGVAVGDEFSGEAADIPKKEKWESGVFAGFAIDLGYVGSWFGRGK